MEIIDVEKEAEELITEQDVKILNSLDKFAKVSRKFSNLQQPQQNQSNNLLFGLEEEVVNQFRQGIRQKFTEQILPNLFTSPQPKEQGWMGMAKDGMKVVQSLAEHPDSPMSQAVGSIINSMANAYNNYNQMQKGNGNGESNKKLPSMEEIILKLEPNDINHLMKFKQIVESNPENPKIDDLNELHNILLQEQNRIREAHNIPVVSQNQNENKTSNEEIIQQQHQRQLQNQGRNRPRNQDINRELMDRYDNPSQYQNYNQNQNINPQSDFFNNSQVKQTPEELIMSLSPDDPISIHQYAYMRNLGNLDAITVKKTLIKEQEQLRKSIVPQNQQKIEVVTGDSWDNKDLNKPVPKSSLSMNEIMQTNEGDDGSVITRTEFEKEINLNQNPQTQIQSLPEQQQQAPELSEQPSNQENQIQNENFDKIMRILDKMDKNYQYLVDEITAIKAGKVINMDYAQLIEGITDVNPDIMGIENDSTIPESNTDIENDNDSDKLKTTTPSIETGTDISAISSVPVPPSTETESSTEEAGTASISTVPAPPSTKEPKEELKEIKNDWWSVRHSVIDSVEEEPKHKQVKRFVIRRHLKEPEKSIDEMKDTTSKEENKQESTEPVE